VNGLWVKSIYQRICVPEGTNSVQVTIGSQFTSGPNCNSGYIDDLSLVYLGHDCGPITQPKLCPTVAVILNNTVNNFTSPVFYTPGEPPVGPTIIIPVTEIISEYIEITEPITLEGNFAIMSGISIQQQLTMNGSLIFYPNATMIIKTNNDPLTVMGCVNITGGTLTIDSTILYSPGSSPISPSTPDSPLPQNNLLLIRTDCLNGTFSDLNLENTDPCEEIDAKQQVTLTGLYVYWGVKEKDGCKPGGNTLYWCFVIIPVVLVVLIAVIGYKFYRKKLFPYRFSFSV
jgi:hypothetical protein